MLQVAREMGYADLQKMLLKEMAAIITDGILTESQNELFRIRVLDGLSGSYLDSSLDHPLYMEAVDEALALCDDDSTPPHVKFILEWHPQDKEK